MNLRIKTFLSLIILLIFILILLSGCSLLRGRIPSLPNKETKYYTANAHSAHFAEGYYVELMINDPNQTVQSVTVSGPGIGDSIYLVKGIHPFYPNQWWSKPNVNLGDNLPDVPLVYTFTITDETGITYNINDSVQSYVESFATNLSPEGTQTNVDNLVFSWNGVEMEGVKYKVELERYDKNWNRIWDSSLTTDTSFTYNGPVLASGDYQYSVVVFDRYGNASLAYQNFQIKTLPEDNPPTIEIISPSDGEIVSGTVRFSSNATDDYALDKVEFYIDGELKSTHGPFSYDNYHTVGSTCNWDCDTTPGSINYIPDGNHNFKAKAYDTAGQTCVDIISFIVENLNIGDDKPYIYYIEPDSGAPGIDASIIGRNFKADFPMVEWVDFGGENISAESWSDNVIKVNVPYGEGVVDVRVVSNFQESNPVKFTYNEPFIDVDGITPSCGLPGEEVTISGKDFGYKGFFGSSFYVNFGCSNKITKSWTDTKLVANAPLDYGTGKIDKTVLKWLIKFAACGADVVIPGLILDKISDLLLKCELEVEPSEGRIKIPVRVHTPAGISNAAVFTYSVSTIVEALLFSPGELRIYDSLGCVAGVVDGEVKEEIPYSLCDGSSIVIVSPLDSYRYEVVGTDEDTYGLEVNFVENGETTVFTATDISITSGAIHQYTIDWDVLSQGGEGVTVQIDFDGDGTPELTITTDSTFTFVPAAIDIDPDTLNLNSKIKWVTAYIELLGGYDVADIDVGTVKLWYEGNSVPAEWGDIQGSTLMVKLNGKSVQDLFSGPVDAATVAVSGELQDGTPFGGNDTIRVISRNN